MWKMLKKVFRFVGRVVSAALISITFTFLIGGGIMFFMQICSPKLADSSLIPVTVTLFSMFFSAFFMCIVLYTFNPKFWDSVRKAHEKKEDSLYRLVPDISIIVEMTDYLYEQV